MSSYSVNDKDNKLVFEIADLNLSLNSTTNSVNLNFKLADEIPIFPKLDSKIEIKFVN